MKKAFLVNIPTGLIFVFTNLKGFNAGIEDQNVAAMSEEKLEKKFGQSPVFVASTLLEDGGSLKNASPASLLKEAIHVISCGYEDKTEWGKEVKETLKFLFDLSTCIIIVGYGLGSA